MSETSTLPTTPRTTYGFDSERERIATTRAADREVARLREKLTALLETESTREDA
jgi:hypothetical protein